MKRLLTAIGIAVATSALGVGVANAKSHGADDDMGDWYAVYDAETGVHLFDYCKCVPDGDECSPCEELVGVASKYGYEGPFIEVKLPTPPSQ